MNKRKIKISFEIGETYKLRVSNNHDIIAIISLNYWEKIIRD